MQQVKVGVVGVGRMGKNHCRVLTTIRSAALLGVFDINKESALQVANRYETDCFQSFDQVLDAVDAVIIATPTNSHHPLTKRSIEAGVHVLVEKPLAKDLSEGEDLTQLAETAGVIVQVGHIERFNPAYRELKNLIKPIHLLAIDSRRLSAYEGSITDVDVIFDLLVHDIDLVTDLIGREPDDIAAIGIRAVSRNIDHVVAHLSYNEGPLVSMAASRVTEEKIRKIDVTALEVFIETDLMDKKVSIKRRTIGEYANHNFDGVKYRQESMLESIHVPLFEPLFLQAQHFIACVRKEETCLVPAQAGLRAMRIGTLVRERANERIIDIPIASLKILPKSEASTKRCGKVSSAQASVHLSILIPCFNEEDNIHNLRDQLLDGIRSLLNEHQVEIIFIDDGSTDGTWNALIDTFGSLTTKQLQFRFERHAENLGLGVALRTGIRAAHGSTIVTTDSDGTYAYDLIPEMIDSLADQFDIVTASPYHPKGSIDGVPAYRVILSRGSSLLYRLIVDRHVYTYTALFRAYRREVFNQVKFEADGFLACAEILVNAHLAGYKVKDFPAALHGREYGNSKAELVTTTLAHLRFIFQILVNRLRNGAISSRDSTQTSISRKNLLDGGSEK